MRVFLEKNLKKHDVKLEQELLPNWFLFCGFAAIPSLAMIERFFEVVLRYLPDAPLGVAITATQGFYLAVLWFGARWSFNRLYALRQGWINALFLLLLSVLFLAFLLIYPLADSGQLGFTSDRDEAIDIAVRQLLNGHYPYLCKAVSGIHDGCPAMGNPIAPLPGALLLASPFVILGGSALQNFFWLVAFYVTLRQCLGDRKFPAVYLTTLLLFSPVVIAEILTGGDHLANALAVTVAIVLVLSATSVQGWMLGGVLLGIALSWRAHFLLVAIPLLVYHLRHGKLKALWVAGTAAAASFAVVTLPFWIASPAEFAPVHIQQRFSDFRHLLPHADAAAIALSVVVGLAAGWWVDCRDDLLIVCGATVIAPILFAVLLNSVTVGHPTFLFYGWYALTGAVLGTLGAVLRATGALVAQPREYAA